MKKFAFALLIFLYNISAVFAQLQSPEQFLGYKIGSRYTPYYRIADYFTYVAATATPQVQLKKYGETYGHRPLYVATISSSANMGNIENIRQQNLQLSQGKGNAATAIPMVWLSYNVHGNETSSSEAAMQTLYELLDQNNTKTQGWLQNTVVIIDPCLNPDGRDRYVNWFNDVVGSTANPDLAAREHHEPWPGGRLNHYNYDLNRDWAWQTQKETVARVEEYQRWMPQVHVDFHEQGVNNPYYFAPAAEPYHEVITPWQKEFQVNIGRNHAKYFDSKGWLYFTNEIFDLFYPSYGDTYPMFNGAIGMTYEQGGGPRGGLAAITAEGDTLTLNDRVMHHVTTGLSTVETASTMAKKLMQEYANYFNNAVAGKVGSYKSYILKQTPENKQNLSALLALLQKNQIITSQGSGSGRGYNYYSKKEESFTYNENDIVVQAAQPQAVLVKALLEPQTKLSDTVTYDITAWALPYAYGIQAYATTQPVSAGRVISTFNENKQVNLPDAYGYVVPWQGVASAKMVSELLKKNVRLRFAEKPFTANGKSFSAGSVIVLKNGNNFSGSTLSSMMQNLANENRIELATVQTGMVEKGMDFGSASVHFMKAPKIMLVTGEGVNPNAAGEVWHFIDQEIQYPVTLVNADDFPRTDLAKYDVIILPDGRFSFLETDVKAEKLQDWVSRGGRLIALQTAVAQLSKLKWSTVKFKDEEAATDISKTEDPYLLLGNYERRERDALTGYTPGAIYKVEVDNTHPLMYGYSKNYYTLKMDDAVYKFIEEGGWNVGVIKKEKPVAGYVGYKLASKLQDGLVFAVQDMGRGAISYLADDVLFRSFWQNGKLIFCNAIFMVGQ